jgi:hypothetical protein
VADHGATRFGIVFYEPTNPEFPVLPDGVVSGHPILFVTTPGLREPRTIIDEIETRRATDSAFHDWFLDGIWRTPNPVDFGNITASKQRTVTIHNTHRTDQSLTTIDLGGITGLSVLSPGLPVTIPAFDSIDVLFEATTTGDPDFDDLVTFTVSGTDVTVRMLGRRVIIWNTIPQRPIIERLSWLTDNMVAMDGTEQSMSLRAAPRTKVTLTERLQDDVDRTTKMATILGAGFLRQGVQLWWQSRTVINAALSTATVVDVNTGSMEIEIGRELSFVTPAGIAIEGEVLTFDPTSVQLTQEIGTALPLGTSVMPLTYGFMANKADFAAFATAVEDQRITFDLIEYSDIGALDMAYFDTHPTDGLPIVTHDLFFRGQSRRANITQDNQRIDGSTGDMQVFRQELLGRWGQPMLVHCNTLDDQHAWRQFLHFIRGSWGRFYVPTGTRDLPLDSNFTLGGNTFTVPHMGIESLIGNVAPRRDIWMNIAGTIYYRRITNVSDNGVIETITIDGVIPGSGSVPSADVRVSWLTLCRLVGDVATFRHERLGKAELRFNIRGVIEA